MFHTKRNAGAHRFTEKTSSTHLKKSRCQKGEKPPKAKPVRQCTYTVHVTMRRVRVTTAAVEKQ